MMAATQGETSVDHSACEHATLQTEARVARLRENEDGPIIGYSVDVRLYCVDCRAPLHFRGEIGMSYNGPRVSFDGQEARLPADMGIPGTARSFADSEAARVAMLLGGPVVEV